jgi:hypothetical protein
MKITIEGSDEVIKDIVNLLNHFKELIVIHEQNSPYKDDYCKECGHDICEC